MIYPHIADAIKAPRIIHLKNNLYVARFESMKIYSTLAAVKHLLESGTIQRSDTLIDSSSGIYAYALALACQKYGLKCHIIASKTVDAALKLQLEMMGAVVEPARSAPSLKMDQQNRVKRIREMLAERSDVHWMQQYHDDIHYHGYREFAQELMRDFDSPELTLIGGVGSGCSTGATAGYLREAGVDVELHGVQPYGSVTFQSEHVDDPGIIIAGIGSAISFKNVRHQAYDYIHWISFDYSAIGAGALLQRYGIFAGLSSGACHAVANWYERLGSSKPCVFIAADTGHRYLEPVFMRAPESDRINGLTPRYVDSTSELSLPWCVMRWQRRAVLPSETMQPGEPVTRSAQMRSALGGPVL